MTHLLRLHSLTRYVVLALALAAAVKFVLGLARKGAPGKADRALGSAFAGLLDLQVTLGLAMVVLGTWYPALAGHVALMVLAAVVAHAAPAVNKRRAQPGYGLPLAGVFGALLLIAGGLMAIGRGLLEARVP